MTQPKRWFACLLATWCLLPAAVPGQGAPKVEKRKVYRDRVRPHWYARNTRFWYRNDLSGGRREFLRVNAVRGAREAAFDHSKLAEALEKATGKVVRATRLPLEDLAFNDADDALRFRAFDKDWYCTRANYRLRAATARDFQAATHIRDLQFGEVTEAQLEFAEEPAA